MNKKLYLIASSLSNAILVCLLISIFSACLVLISHYQNILNNKLEFEENLIHINNSTFTYFLKNIDLIDISKWQETDVLDEGITTHVNLKKWGFYNVLICKTIFKNDTIIKSGLIGQKTANENLALFLTNYDKTLQTAGEVTIVGDVEIPNARFDKAFIHGETTNTFEFKGGINFSKDRIPKIENQVEVDLNHTTIDFKSISSELSIHTFDKATLIIDMSGINELKEVSLKGNYIIRSDGELVIANSAQLEDVLIVAPKVSIESGFIGEIQIVSNEKVEIQDHVLLKYPSSIYIKNDIDSVKVSIGENSKLAGGIVIDGNTYEGSLKRELIVEPNSTVYGTVYCFGRTQLQGSVFGTIYTDRFFLNTESSNYENVILNGTINKDSLPKAFITLPLFLNATNQRPNDLVKAL